MDFKHEANSSTTMPSNPGFEDEITYGPLWMRIVAVLIAGSGALVGGIGNLAVLLAFATHQRSLWIKQNVYIFCLTISDLIIATVVQVELLDQFLSGRWRHSHAWCRAYLTIVSLMFVGSLNLVALISRDRMLIVTMGAAYDAYESARRKWLIVSASMVYVLIGCMPYTSLDIFTGHSISLQTGKCVPEQIQNLAVTLVNQVIFPFPPFLYMLYCYGRVRQSVKQRTTKFYKYAPPPKSIKVAPVTNGVVSTNNLTRETKFGREITLTLNGPSKNVIVPFAVSVAKLDKLKRTTRIMHALILNALYCPLPSTVLSVIMNVLTINPTMVTQRTYAWWSHLHELTFMLRFLGSAVNPILYAYRMPSYRVAMRDVVCCPKTKSVPKST